jgi:predicted dehydrogenase
MKRIRLAIVGAGHLGRIHARLARSLSEIELVAVVDPLEANRGSVAAENHCAALESHRQLLGMVDAAVIAAPTRHHHEVSLDLLRSGIHLLVEKPITLCAADADELIAAAEQSQCVLQVGHVERFNPAFLAARHACGRPRLIEAVRAAPYTFRSTDVSVVLDLMIHDIDLALSLTGSEVQRIDAVGGKVIGPNEDWAQARLQFASGAVASLFASRVQANVQRTMHVVAERGLAWLDFHAKTARVLQAAGELEKLDGHRLSAAERAALQSRLPELLPVRELPVPENNAILEELREFAAAVGHARPVSASGVVGRDAVAVAERVLAAIAAQHESVAPPVVLPFLPKRHHRWMPTSLPARRAG